MNSASAGDEIIIDDGIYYEKLDITKPLTIRAKNPGAVTVTNKHNGTLHWSQDGGYWYASNVNWPVHFMLVDGFMAQDYEAKTWLTSHTFKQYASKNSQSAGGMPYRRNPRGFAWESGAKKLWIDFDPSGKTIEINGASGSDTTLVQKDVGTMENQQQSYLYHAGIPNIFHDYATTDKYYNPPNFVGVLVKVKAHNVTVEGLRLIVAPTTAIEVYNVDNTVITECFIKGYQWGINTRYKATNTTVTHCEFDGSGIVSKTAHLDYENETMLNHSCFIIPVAPKGSGFVFRHNYVYEAFDAIQPRGVHKDYISKVENIQSEFAYNTIYKAYDNALELDAVEAAAKWRFHHNFISKGFDGIAVTTLKNAQPCIIDHNLIDCDDTGGRIMKLDHGDAFTGAGVMFVHNTAFLGNESGNWGRGKFTNNGAHISIFENNIAYSANNKEQWSASNMGDWFPTQYNICYGGNWLSGYTENPDPKLANTFEIPQNSSAIGAGINKDAQYFHSSDGPTECGALEYGETIDDWRAQFGHCGPRWITESNEQTLAPWRPALPSGIGRKWAGLDGGGSTGIHKNAPSRKAAILPAALRKIMLPDPHSLSSRAAAYDIRGRRINAPRGKKLSLMIIM